MTQLASYSSGVGGRGDWSLVQRSLRLAGNRAPLRSGDWHLNRATLEVLRAESRRAERNTPHVRAVLEAKQHYCLGRGLRTQSMVRPATVTERGAANASSAQRGAQWAERAESIFDAWGAAARLGGHASEKSIDAVERLALKGETIDGDVLVIAVADAEGMIRLQVIDADLVVQPPLGAVGGGTPGVAGGAVAGIAGSILPANVAAARHAVVSNQPMVVNVGGQVVTLPPGHDVIEGVHLDAFGEVAGYFVSKYTAGGVVSRDGANYRYIPASAAYMFVNAERVQTRGTPAFASTVEMAQYLGRTLIATVLAAEVQAAQSEMIESDKDAPTMGVDPAVGGARTPEGDAEAWAAQAGGQVEIDEVDGVPRVIADMQPGQTRIGLPGQRLNRPTPTQPNPALPGFATMFLRFIGAPHGIGIEAAMNDLSQVNFHSGRASIYLTVERQVAYRVAKFNPFRQWCWRLVVGSAIAAGALEPVDGWDRIDTLGPGRPMLDVADELKGLGDARAANLITMKKIAAEFGDDYREQLEQLARERQMEKDLGITPALMPGAKAGDAGGSAGADSGGGSAAP